MFLTTTIFNEFILFLRERNNRKEEKKKNRNQKKIQFQIYIKKLGLVTLKPISN